MENNRGLFPLSLLFFSSFFCCLIVFRVALGLKKQQALNGVVMSCLGVGRTSTVSRTLTFSCAECLVSSRNCRRDFRHYSITLLQFGVTCLWDQTCIQGWSAGRPSDHTFRYVDIYPDMYLVHFTTHKCVCTFDFAVYRGLFSRVDNINSIYTYKISV